MEKIIIVIDEKITDRSKRMKEAVERLKFNPMCYDCKKFKKGCAGESDKIYSNCVYRQKDETKESIYAQIHKSII